MTAVIVKMDTPFEATKEGGSWAEEKPKPKGTPHLKGGALMLIDYRELERIVKNTIHDEFYCEISKEWEDEECVRRISTELPGLRIKNAKNLKELKAVLYSIVDTLDYRLKD